jgi:hypothetical protein
MVINSFVNFVLIKEELNDGKVGVDLGFALFRKNDEK